MKHIPTKVIAALVGVFALHNVEEAFGFAEWASTRLPPALAARYELPAFALASGLLTLLYLACAVWVISVRSKMSALIFIIATAALVANGLLHVVGNIAFARDMPGFWTATFLIIPLGFYFAWTVVGRDKRSWLFAFIGLGFGGLLQLPLIFGAMWFAETVLQYASG